MNRSAQLKDRELQLLAISLLIIPEIHSSATLDMLPVFVILENYKFGKKSA